MRLFWTLDASPDKRGQQSEEAQTSKDAQWCWCLAEVDEALEERRAGRSRSLWRARFEAKVWGLKGPWPGHYNYTGERRDLSWIRAALGAKESA